MGACLSEPDGPPEGGELSRLADKLVKLGVQRNTVNDALRIFWQADKDESGSIGIREFARMFQLRPQNVFLPRLVALFDVSGDGEIGPLEFILCLAQFHEGSAQAHLYFAWRLFDQDDSGSMTMEEFETIANTIMSFTGKQKGFTQAAQGDVESSGVSDRVVMSGLLGAKVKVKGIRKIVEDMDEDNDGVITINEFKIIAANLTHLVAPAFELWTTLEKYAEPCFRLKEELKKCGKIDEVLRMLDPKLQESLGKRKAQQSRAAPSGNRTSQPKSDAKSDKKTRDRRRGMGDNRVKPRAHAASPNSDEGVRDKRDDRRDDRDRRGDDGHRRHHRDDHDRGDRERRHHRDGDDRRRESARDQHYGGAPPSRHTGHGDRGSDDHDARRRRSTDRPPERRAGGGGGTRGRG